jgi:hypothetical protein
MEPQATTPLVRRSVDGWVVALVLAGAIEKQLRIAGP